MAKRKPQPPAEDDEERKIEDKIKKMLDPREPDESNSPSFEVIKEEPEDSPAGDVAEQLPKKIEIKEHTDDEENSTAPPLDKSAAEAELQDEPEEAPAEEQLPDDSNNSSEEGVQTAPELEAKELDKSQASDELVEEKSTAEQIESSNLASPDQPDNEPDKKQDDTTEPEKTKADKGQKDVGLDAAVTDIVESESDKMLEAEDKEVEKAFDDKKPTFSSRVKGFFAAWWHNKVARRTTIGVLLLALIAAGTVPFSRYFILNAAGVRSSASVHVTDESTFQPLKNVKVTIHGQSATTDKDGNAVVYDVKLGSAKMIIEKRAFATIDRGVTIGWGSNPLGDYQLKPVGTQYSFVVTDFVSGKPLEKIEAVSGESSAFSDSEGKIKLTMDMPPDEFEVQLTGEQLRTETLNVNADNHDDIKVQMVPSKKHIFISKRSGNYDVYAVYADGKDEELVLKGTGSEREDITLVPHPTEPVAALVSTRNNQRNSDGFLLSELTILNLEDKEKPVTVTESERIQLIGWKDQRLVFVQIAAGTSAPNPQRHRLKTYNINEDTTAELASANYFNDVMIAKDLILYAPSSAYSKTPTALYRINPDGSDKQIVHPEEVWSLFRTGHDNVSFTTGPDWYQLGIDDRYVEKLDGEPSSLKSRVYVDNPANTYSLWVDQRDGKGTLLLTTIENGEDKVLVARSGLKLPVFWLNDSTVVYRVANDTETADYVVSVDGGESRKVADVTDTAGLDRWYYY